MGNFPHSLPVLVVAQASSSAAKGFAAFRRRVVPGAVPTMAGCLVSAHRKAVMLTALQDALARYGTLADAVALARAESLPYRLQPDFGMASA